jgi:serine/threonine protein kinase
MLPESRNANDYGAGGAISDAVARDGAAATGIASKSCEVTWVAALPGGTTAVAGVLLHWSFGQSVAFALGIALSCLIAQLLARRSVRVACAQPSRTTDPARLGSYLLEKKIGQGGMGTIYRAHHALLRRPAAIKLLPEGSASEHAVARFEREVQHTSLLTHPNTVSIYDYGYTPGGGFYYAMEYLDGLDLQTLVDSFGPQDPSRVAHLLAQVAASLGEAHSRGLVHRDIKPANVIVCERGGMADFVKVVDFGLVKDVETSVHPGITAANSILGTPLYMAPESILSPDRVDARADLYALGALGYFLLTGQPVFAGRSVIEICGRHLTATPVAPSKAAPCELPPDFEALLLKCLAKRPEDRPQSAAEFCEALLACAIEPWTEARARSWWAASSERGADYSLAA